ncbi:MAG: xanthine dehydrogenase small subunit [Pseudomonadota bacterium]|nr:xanthine dehydrogenase small subunit [Pseudomonadota bacterium]
MIRFNLNGRWIESSEIDPNCTILKYLRTNLKQVDVKEGCAAGDCGACTLMLGEMTEHGIEYRTINSCIALMAQVHNRYLLTPSGIGRPGNLHPAQQAMIDTHGSQCGFCTPGFIMSMANLYQNACINETQALTDAEIHAALSGNLCRCTGYRPIIDAAKQMAELPRVDVRDISARSGVQAFDPAAADTAEALQEKDGHRLFMPYTEAQLQALLKAYPDARLWAGGTDIGLEVTQRFSQFDTIICVNRIPELAQCLAAGQDMGDQLWLGAGVTFSQAETALADSFPSFAQLLHRIGSRQIRNMGTLGGNIANASPIGDTPPVFLALAATLEIDGIQGRREVPLKDFYLGYKQTVMQPGEYLRAIRISPLGAGESLTTYKISKRYDDDISAVMFALYLNVQDGLITEARLACGGMAATPLLAAKTNAALTGKPFTLETFTAAAACIEQDYQPLSDVRASDRYRLQVTRNLLTKAFIELSQKGEAA